MKKVERKKCKECKELFTPFRSTQVVCSTICAVSYTKNKALDNKKKVDGWIKQDKDRKGLTTLIKSVVNVFHEYVRLRDQGKPCIACGTEWKPDFQASHFYKAELYSTLKFNENNALSGCMECNLRKEGNLNEYAINLPKRIGLDNYDKLNRLAELDKKIKFKWNREELNSLRKYYREKLNNFQ